MSQKDKASKTNSKATKEKSNAHYVVYTGAVVYKEIIWKRRGGFILVMSELTLMTAGKSSILQVDTSFLGAFCPYNSRRYPLTVQELG